MVSIETLCEAHAELAGEATTPDKMRALLVELKIPEDKIDFKAFATVFTTKKTGGIRLNFTDLDTEGKGVIEAADLKRALEPRNTFGNDFLAAGDAEEIIQCASPTGKVSQAEFGNLKMELDKRAKIYETFKMWDKNEDGKVGTACLPDRAFAHDV